MLSYLNFQISDDYAIDIKNLYKIFHVVLKSLYHTSLFWRAATEMQLHSLFVLFLPSYLILSILKFGQRKIQVA